MQLDTGHVWINMNINNEIAIENYHPIMQIDWNIVSQFSKNTCIQHSIHLEKFRVSSKDNGQ